MTLFVSFLYVIPGLVDISKFTINKANVKRLSILIKQLRLQKYTKMKE